MKTALLKVPLFHTAYTCYRHSFRSGHGIGMFITYWKFYARCAKQTEMMVGFGSEPE